MKQIPFNFKLKLKNQCDFTTNNLFIDAFVREGSKNNVVQQVNKNSLIKHVYKENEEETRKPV